MAYIKLIVVLALCLGLAGWASAQQALWESLNQQVMGLYREGKYAEGIPVAEKALEVATRTLGKDHPDVATALNNLAELYRSQERYSDAEPLHKRSLAIREKALGKDHPDVAMSLTNLAQIYELQGRYSEAELLFKRGLAIYEKNLGKDHPDVEEALINLIVLYLKQDKHAEAEPLCKRYLEIAGRTADRDHPYVAATLQCLADGYRQQGKYAEAEPLYRRQLEIQEKALGKDHPDLVAVLMRLAHVCEKQNKYDEAGTLWKRDLEIAEKALGKDHRYVATALHHLAALYWSQGRYGEAEPLSKRVLEIDKKTLGKDHPDVATALNNLAALYLAQGRYSESEALYSRSLAIHERALGKDHPDVVNCLNGLAELYRHMSRYSAAERLYERSLAIRKKALGEDHPEVASSLRHLGVLYQDLGNDAEALRMFERSLAIGKRKGLSIDSEQNLIANIYLDRGEITKAERILTESKSDPTTRGRLCLMKKQFEKAKHYYEEVRIFGQAGNVEYRFIADTGLGMAYEGLLDYQHAEEYYRMAIKSTEELRSSLKPADRDKFFDVRISGFYRTTPYDGLARVLIRMNKPLEALKEGSESSKARVFSEKISSRSGIAELNIPADLLQQGQSIQDRLAALKRLRDERLMQFREDAGGPTLQVFELEDQLQEYVRMLRKKYPLFAATKYPQPLDLEQTAVKPSEWTLAYQVTDTGICVWLLKGKHLVKSDFKHIARKELYDVVRSFRKPLEITPEDNFYEKLKAFDPAKGKELADLLLGDLLDPHLLPPAAPVIVVPDGILGLLPFEMLVIKEGQGWNTSAQRPYPEGVVYFGDRNPISYYQSLTALTLARTLGKQQKAGDRTLAMVDPVFDKDDTRFIQLAREKQQKQRASLDKIRNETLMSDIKTELGLEFPRLTLTSQLGEALRKADPGKTDLYEGFKAEKSVLFGKNLKRYRFCVFATHGYVGEGLPGIMEPVLVLTLVDQPKDKDGFLRMSEVMSLDLSADVVALTACQTGLGREVKGEGTMGMGRAFQYAGAKSVLMSLWSVSEVSTTRMAEKFLSYIKEGKNRLEALRLARKDIRAEGYEHPFYWAPFILVGEVN